MDKLLGNAIHMLKEESFEFLSVHFLFISSESGKRNAKMGRCVKWKEGFHRFLNPIKTISFVKIKGLTTTVHNINHLMHYSIWNTDIFRLRTELWYIYNTEKYHFFTNIRCTCFFYRTIKCQAHVYGINSWSTRILVLSTFQRAFSNFQKGYLRSADANT